MKEKRGKQLYEKAFKNVPAEQYRDRILGLAEDAYSAIRSIARLDDRRRLHYVGSSLLFSVGARSFVITAGHVLDAEEDGPLHIGTPAGPVPLPRPRRWTKPPDGIREKDRIDLGFVLLDSDTMAALEGCRYLTPEDIEMGSGVSDVREGFHDHVAIGFPGGWASNANPEITRLKPMFLVSSQVPAAAYSTLGVADHSHILIEFDKRNCVDLDGYRIPPKLNGMSGGGLWRFDSLHGPTGTRDKLVGVLVEVHKSVIVATRIGLVMEALRTFFPDLKDAFPPMPGARVTSVLE
jgi:hypothetical protein